MVYLLAGVAGLAAALAGWFVTGLATLWIAGLFGMSDFEGARATFAFLAVGPLGGLVAMITATRAVLGRGRGPAPLGRTLGRIALALGILVAGVAGGIAVRLFTSDTYTNEAPPVLEFEIRLPASLPVADRAAVHVALDTDRNVADGELTDPWSRTESAHRILTGAVPLAFKTRSRLLVVRLAGQPARLFALPLSRDPDSTPALGEWRRATHLEASGSDRAVAAPNDDPFELRYRVRRAGEE